MCVVTAVSRWRLYPHTAYSHSEAQAELLLILGLLQNCQWSLLEMLMIIQT